jgi:uncharacterized membrane protein YvbJ
VENTQFNKISFCPTCKFSVQDNWFFCPNCGKLIKDKPLEISTTKQILIYGVSFFLSPLGLAWGLKYIRSKDKKTKNIGIISIVLTVISIILMIAVSKNFIDQYAKLLNNINPY